MQRKRLGESGPVTLLLVIAMSGLFCVPAGAAADGPLEAEASEVVDETLREKAATQELPGLVEAWTRDAEYEVSLIGKETFAETLDQTANHNQNYLRLIFSPYYFHPAQSGLLQRIAFSRRFAKLVEEMREGGPSEDQIQTLLTRYRSDIEKLRTQRAKIEAGGEIYGFHTGATFDPSLEDPTDLCNPLCYRISATELLIGQFGVYEALPLVLESLQAREGSMTFNWTGAAYVCDKLLVAEPPDTCTKAQRALRDEYLQWRAAMSDRSVFKYVQVEVPTYRSARRPHERATAMGESVSTQEGTVEIEYPPVYDSEFVLRVPSQPPAHPLQPDIVAFARRFAEAGG